MPVSSKLPMYLVPDGYFAISGLRVFGKGKGKKPEAVGQLEIERDSIDRRIVQLQWESSHDAVGYNVKYGFSSENLYLNYKVYTDTSVVIRSLNKDLPYYFPVEAFNENGVAPYGQAKRVD